MLAVHDISARLKRQKAYTILKSIKTTTTKEKQAIKVGLSKHICYGSVILMLVSDSDLPTELSGNRGMSTQTQVLFSGLRRTSLRSTTRPVWTQRKTRSRRQKMDKRTVGLDRNGK